MKSGLWVVQRQEEYRRRTIALIRDMHEEGMKPGEIAENVGINRGEASRIINTYQSIDRAIKTGHKPKNLKPKSSFQKFLV